MTNREKLKKLVLGCIGDRGWATQPELVDYLIANGVTVKELQKPLTLEEVKEKKAVWVETKIEDEDLYPALLCGRSYKYFSEFCTNVGKDEGFVLRDNDEYGVAWRCWTEKPTEEEREAAEWEK